MRRVWILKTVAFEPPPWRQRMAGRVWSAPLVEERDVMVVIVGAWGVA